MKQALRFLLALIFCTCTVSSIAGNKKPAGAPSSLKPITTIKMLSTFLFAANGNIADGNRVVFDAQYSNAIDGNDAIKLLNPGENFGLNRDNRILAVEARQPISNGDTIFYNMSNLVAQVYRLEIAPENLSSTTNIHCSLIDRYLNTVQNISLTDSNHLTLLITNDAASRASNRLIIVFSDASTVPAFSFANISATNDDNRSVIINWEVNNEMNVSYYEIERSADNMNFEKLSTKLPYHTGDNTIYKFNDSKPINKDNYYRIRSVKQNGESVYSDKAKVTIEDMRTGMNIYPNPVTDHHFQLRLQKIRPGKYYMRLINSFGQQVYTVPLNINNNNFMQVIYLDPNIGKGNYCVSLWNEEGIVCTQKLLVTE